MVLHIHMSIVQDEGMLLDLAPDLYHIKSQRGIAIESALFSFLQNEFYSSQIASVCIYHLWI